MSERADRTNDNDGLAASDIRLIHEAVGDKLFAFQADADTTRMQQNIWWEVRNYGPLVLETASLSIDAIEARYPHLRPGLVSKSQ